MQGRRGLQIRLQYGNPIKRFIAIYDADTVPQRNAESAL